jgi:HEAT repeat protein
MTALTLSLCIVSLGVTARVEAANRVIAEQIKRLDKGQPAAVRLTAAKLLWRLETAPAAAQAIPALAVCAKDRDVELRRVALMALGETAFLHKRPCPLPVVEGLFDPNPNVRGSAWTNIGLFREYPKEALPLLLRAADHEDRNVRLNVLLPLATVGGKSPEVLTLLKKKTTDKDPLIRNNAHVALYQATKDLELIVRYWLERADTSPALGLGKAEQLRVIDETRSAKMLEMLTHWSAKMLGDVGRERPAELAGVLLKLLSDKSPLMRRNSARVLGAMAGESEKARGILKRLAVEGELERLLRDPDASVRSAAEGALKKMKGH